MSGNEELRVGRQETHDFVSSHSFGAIAAFCSFYETKW
jgi:hypothetical protein